MTLALSSILAGCGGDSLPINPAQAQSGNTQTVAWSQDPTVALAELQAGNARYVNGTNQKLTRSVDRPLILNSTQAPGAAILSCADSRVPPELAMDQAWGQLFVVRLAGNVAETNGVASFEYAVTALGVRLIVVLGHEQCGAVSAAITNALPAGNLNSLIQLIVPAAQSVHGQPGNELENAIKANVVLQASRLRSLSPTIDKAAGSGQVVIKGGLYHFDTGEIELLPSP